MLYISNSYNSMLYNLHIILKGFDNMLCKRLQDLRDEKKLFQKDIAKVLNITDSAYGFYERGERTPSIDTIIKLADFYDVSIDYIVGRSKIKKPSSVESFESLTEDAKSEINAFIEYIKNKYKK